LFYLNLSPVAPQACPPSLADFFLQCADSDFELSPVECSSQCATASVKLEGELVATRPVAADCFAAKNVPVHFNAKSVAVFQAAIQGTSLCAVNSSGGLAPQLWLFALLSLYFF